MVDISIAPKNDHIIENVNLPCQSHIENFEERPVDKNNVSQNLYKDFKIKMCSLNLAGWTSNNAELKKEIIMKCEGEIICVQETHLTKGDVIDIEGYKFFSHPRKVQHKKAPHNFGGVGIFVKNCLFENFVICVVDMSLEGFLLLSLTHKVTERQYLVGSCYLPPENSPYGRDSVSFFSHILSFIYLFEDSDGFWLLGDFNSRIGNLKDFNPGTDDIPDRVVIDSTSNQHGKSFIEFLIEANMCVLNGRGNQSKDNFTFVKRGRSTVDYIVTKHENLASTSLFEVVNMSDFILSFDLVEYIGEHSKPPDHSLLSCEIRVDDILCENVDVEVSNVHIQNRKRIYKMKEKPENVFVSDIAQLAIENMINSILLMRETQVDLNMTYNNLITEIIDEMNREIPYIDVCSSSKKRYKVNKPFWNEELRELWKVMNLKEKDFRKQAKQKSILKQTVYLEFKAARVLFDKRLRYHERKYNRGNMIKIEEACTNNPRNFWDYVKNLGPQKKKLIPVEVIDNDGIVVSDTTVVLERWKSDFEKLYNCNQNCFDDDFKREKVLLKESWERAMLDPLYIENKILNKNFSIMEVKHMVLKAKNKKAVGLDKVPNEMFKNDPMISVLLEFFQACFDSSLIPDLWRQSLIFPIPKDPKKDKRIPLNYRGISLLSTISKLYTAILNKRILDFAELSGVLADEQNGFRPNRNCIDHIFSLTSIIRNRKNQGQSTFCCFIDYQKAFDYVDRDLLLYKLQLYQINGKIYHAISGLYTNTSACVLLNQYITPWFHTNSGVRQGDSLSPTLFALYINDLISEINDLKKGIVIDTDMVTALLYADDLVIMSDNEVDLNCILDIVNKWCIKWRVLINQDKSKVVHFRPKRLNRTEVEFTLGSNILEVVSEYKYLGIFLNEYLLYEYTADILSKSATRALGSVINKFRSLKNMGFKTYTKLFNACVVPVIDYSSEIWGFKPFECSEKVQINALRFFFGVHKFAAHHALYGDSGWFPGVVNRNCNMIRYWNRMLNMDDDRLTKKIFNHDLKLNSFNWCSEICKLLEKCNMKSAFTNREVCDIRLIRDRLECIAKTEWVENQIKYPKLRTYTKFKTTFGTEMYLDISLNRKERSILSQFRFGILPIRIESGRFVGERPEERICIYCQNNSIEDEIHLLFECEQYKDIRNSILGFEILEGDQISKMVTLLTWKSRKTATFLLMALERRKSITYND